MSETWKEITPMITQERYVVDSLAYSKFLYFQYIKTKDILAL